MQSMILLYQLLGLKASNHHLLRIYSLLCSGDNSEAEMAPEELEERIAVRYQLEKEIQEYIKKNFIDPEGKFTNKLLLPTLSWCVEKEYQIRALKRTSLYEQSYFWEKENVKKYYQILYIAELPIMITEILLDQKSKVENYLLSGA